MTDPITSFEEWKRYRDQLRSELQGLLGKPLKPGLRREAWTPAQVLHHVLLVDATTADLLERLQAKAGTLVERNASEPWPFRAELMDFPLDTAFSVPAFQGTEPKAKVSEKTLKDLADSTGKRHTVLAQTADRYQLDKVAFPHPLAGRLNFYEWVVFGGVHESLHLTQLKHDLGLLD